jgi:PKD repeat protein
MKQLIRKFKQISILILAIFIVGCEQDDAALPKITAGFTYKINLNTGTVTFINISENAQTYEWSFGDDNKTSKDVNPIYTYPTSGTYTVILKAKNSAGAMDTFESDITFTLIDKVVLPITFDISTVGYDAAVFNGASFAIVDNPSVSGTNNKASKVGAITNSGKAFEGINFDLGAPIDLTTEKSIKMNFWANAPVAVLMKLEEGTASTPDVVVNHTGTGWEEMIFSFTSSSKYSILTLFVDGPGTKAGTFYFDDVTQIETPAPPCTAETLENINPANGDFNWTFKTNDLAHTIESFGNISSSIVTNPVFDGINTSCNVEKIVKTAGCETWSGIGKELATALDFTKTTTNKVFKMKVLAETQVAGVTLRLERLPHPDTDPAIERVASITQVGVWQELTFDFSDVSTGTYKSLIIYFERNASCDGDVYFLDDIMQVAGTGGSGGGACTTDAAQTLTAADFNLTFASNPGTMATRGEAVGKFLQDGTTYTYVDNPGASALNNSCKVGKVTNNNQNPWDNVQIDLANKLTITDGSNFKIKVYAPQSGYKVTLKLEDKASNGATNSGDKPSTTSTTLTNGWEELTFNIGAGDSGKYDKIVLFFDLQTQNGNTYYFDDLKLNLGTGGGTGGGGTGTTSGIANNGDFETGTLDGWAVYPNGGIVIADNTENNGGTWSGKLVASPTGLNPTLKQERKGAGAINAGDRVQIKFDYKGSSAGGGIYSIQSFVEAANGVSQTQNISVTPTATWQTYSNTYTVGAGDSSGGITMEFVAICGGVTGCSSTLYLDNVSITINP